MTALRMHGGCVGSAIQKNTDRDGDLMDEKRLQLALYNELISRQVLAVVPNLSWAYLYNEADLVSISRSFYLSEFEIKTSTADFKNEFLNKDRKYYRMRWGETAGTPNYFSYFAPEYCYPLCVPDFAGIYIAEYNRFNNICVVEVRKPKLIHKKKLSKSETIKIIRTLMFKYFSLAKSVDNRKRQSLFKN